MGKDAGSLNRRSFLKSAGALAGTALVAGAAHSQDAADGLLHRNERSDRMQYRKLGRTNFMSSKLVFGCGAALAGGKAVRLLDSAFESGVNFYDVGSNAYYKGAENSLAPFYKAHRDEIFVASKAPVRIEPRPEKGQPITLEAAKYAARAWTGLLDQSLTDLGTDYIDAYYIMMVNEPSLVKSEEMNNAFQTAKAAGKVGFFGISTHSRAQECLDAAIEAGFYDLAMIAVSPAGWYSPTRLGHEEGTASLQGLRPTLDRAREAGIGLVGMKAGRYLSQGEDKLAAFDEYYNDNLKQAKLSPFQKAYAYVLENGLDVVNADMQSFEHFEENLYAAQTSGTYFA